MRLMHFHVRSTYDGACLNFASFDVVPKKDTFKNLNWQAKANSMWDVGFFHNWQAKAPHAKTSSSASPTPSPYKCKLSFYLVLK